MTAARNKTFRLNIGSLGLTILILGISTMLLASFVFGVLVGRNIESYPEKIARGIPATIKEKMTGSEEVAVAATDPKGDVPLTFYKTLSRREETGITPIPAEAPAAVRIESATRSEEKRVEKPSPARTPALPDAFTIQVAAFRDRASAERLQSRLASLNYAAHIHESGPQDQDTWFRLRIEGFDTREAAQGEAKRIEGAVRGLKCLILKN